MKQILALMLLFLPSTLAHAKLVAAADAPKPQQIKSPAKADEAEDYSQRIHEHSFGVGFGQVILMGDLAKQVSDTIGLGLIYDYKASELFGVMVEGGYSKHIDSTGKNSFIARSFSPNLRVNLSYFDNLTIFAFGGFGIYSLDKTLFPTSGSVTTFGLDMGPGFELRLAPHAKFGSFISFNNAFTKSDSQAVNSLGNGMSIGGTYMRLFLTASYIF